jgi:uncharacterized protein YdiU (UPF0061 family)
MTKHDIYNINVNTSIIIGLAEEFLNKEFINILKDHDPQLYQRLSLVVVDKCHTVDTWWECGYFYYSVLNTQ